MSGYIQKGWANQFFQSPNSIFDVKDLKMAERLCYLYLCRCADGDLKSFPSYKKIGEKMGASRVTAIKSVRILEEKGYLQVKRRKESRDRNLTNIYTLIHPDNVIDGTEFEHSKESVPPPSKESVPPPSKESVLPSKESVLSNKYPDINTQSTINTQQQERVVCLRKKYESLFKKTLNKKQAESLLELADKVEADIMHKMQNTYDFHTKVEPCRSIVASIKRSITHGDWDISTPVQRSSKPAKSIDVPKSYYRVTKTRTAEEEAELAIKQAQLEAKIKAMYADDALESSQL